MFTIPASITVVARGHTMELSTASITDEGALKIFLYGAQRGVNDPLGKLGKGFKADSPENIASVEDRVNTVWTALMNGSGLRSGPRQRTPADPHARAVQAIVRERLDKYVEANQAALFKTHNVANITAFRKAGLHTTYSDKIAAKYADEISAEAKRRVAAQAKSVPTNVEAEGDTLGV